VVDTFLTNLPVFEAEIEQQRDLPEDNLAVMAPVERLTEAARRVEPAAGLAETAALAVNTQLNPSVAELAALYDLAQAVRREHSRELIAAAFTDKLQALLPHDLCAVTLAMPLTGEKVVVHARGAAANQMLGRRITPGEGVTGWVLANRRPLANTDPRLDLPPPVAGELTGWQTLAVYPILQGAEMYGAVSVYAKRVEQYTPAQQLLLREAVLLLGAALATAPAFGGLGSVLDLGAPDVADPPLESDLAH
jgi:hypothetical protein